MHVHTRIGDRDRDRLILAARSEPRKATALPSRIGHWLLDPCAWEIREALDREQTREMEAKLQRDFIE